MSKLTSDVIYETLSLSPSAAATTWGSVMSFPYTEKNRRITKQWLELTTSALTQTGGTYVRFIPGGYHIQQTELLSGGQPFLTIIGDDMALLQYVPATAEQLVILAAEQGDHATVTNRNSASAAAQVLLIPMTNVLDQVRLAIHGTNATDITIRITLKPLASVVEQDGTVPVATFSSPILKMQTHRLEKNELTASINKFKMGALVYPFMKSLTHQNTGLASGITQSSTVLTSFAGVDVAFMYFIVRPLAPTAGNLFKFVQVTSFSIQDASSNTITGEASHTDLIARTEMFNKWFPRSAFACSTNMTVSSTSTTNYIYFYAFCEYPERQLISPTKSTGFRHFAGNEKLVLNWGSATGAAYQLDVFAYTHSGLLVSQGHPLRIM
jgi:hypothetical protein